MIEGVLVLLLVLFGGWLLLVSLGMLLKLLLWLMVGACSLVGGSLFIALLLPLGLVLTLILSLIALPILFLAAFHLAIPLLLLAGVIWFLRRDGRRDSPRLPN